MAFSSSSSDSSEFNIDPIVEEEVVWRTEKVKNIALVVKFEKLPMFTQETDSISCIFKITYLKICAIDSMAMSERSSVLRYELVL